MNRQRHPTTRERFEVRVRVLGELVSALGQRDVDLVVLNDVPPTFGARIVTRGRRVHCASAALDHAFLRDVQLRAADLEPFLRRTRRIKAAAVRS